MTTATRERMAAVVDKVAPHLRHAGFRRRGLTFNRPRDQGILHVVGFQMGRADPPGTVEIPGIRENLHGWFTINVGIFVPEIHDEDVAHGLRALKPGAFVGQSHCSFFWSVGELSPLREHIWFRLSGKAVDLHQLIVEAIDQTILPFLAELGTRAAILDSLRTGSLPGHREPWSWRYKAALMLKHVGDLESAMSLASDDLADAVGQPWEESSRETYARLRLI